MNVETSSAARTVHEYDASHGAYSYAWNDLRSALSNLGLLAVMVRNDFRSRYKGTALGGFWITITTLITVSGLALVYGVIFQADMRVYFPYVAIGITIWGSITLFLNEGASTFTGSAAYFTQMPVSKSFFAFKTLGRGFLTLAYRSIVIGGVLVFTGNIPDIAAIALAFAGVLLTFWTGFWVILICGVLSARFRDLAQLIGAGATFAFFLTPVFWQTERLGDYEYLVNLNPFFHFLHIVRGPLLGLDGVAMSFMWAGVIAALVTALGWAVFGLFARRLPYWCN